MIKPFHHGFIIFFRANQNAAGFGFIWCPELDNIFFFGERSLSKTHATPCVGDAVDFKEGAVRTGKEQLAILIRSGQATSPTESVISLAAVAQVYRQPINQLWQLLSGGSTTDTQPEHINVAQLLTVPDLVAGASANKQPRKQSAPRRIGQVVRYQEDKDYGFIAQPGLEDVFVHVNNAVPGALASDAWVVFTQETNPKDPTKLRATQVKGLASETAFLRANLSTFPTATLRILLEHGPESLRESIAGLLLSELLALPEQDNAKKLAFIELLEATGRAEILQFVVRTDNARLLGLSSSLLIDWLLLLATEARTNLLQQLTQSSRNDLLLDLWVGGHSDYFNFERYYLLVATLPQGQQFLFLRKVFGLIKTGAVNLSVEDLNSIPRHSREDNNPSGRRLDYSIDLVLRVLMMLKEKAAYPGEKDIIDCLIAYVGNSTKELLEFSHLFAPCPDRTSLKFNPPEERKVTTAVIGSKTYPAASDKSHIIRADGEQLPVVDDGVWFNGKHYPIKWVMEPEIVTTAFIGSKTYPAASDKSHIIRADGEQLPVVDDGVWFNGKHYPIDWVVEPKYDWTWKHYQEKSNGNRNVTCCEGNEALAAHKVTGESFWWCYGRECHKANQTKEVVEEWQQFVLKDFIQIARLPFIEEAYYRAIGLINRTNELLRKLYCKGCGTMLRPAETSAYNFFRVTKFECTAKGCSQNGVKIYLNRCLNGKCGSVIDSRESVKCNYDDLGQSNWTGMHICDNCGSCCSKQKLQQKISMLESVYGVAVNGVRLYKSLVNQLKLGLYHADKFKSFCHRCRTPMHKDYEKSDYYCPNCKDVKVKYSYSVAYLTVHKKKVTSMIDEDSLPVDSE